MGHTDDGRPERCELVRSLGEIMSLRRAPRRERRGIEIQHHGTLLEGIRKGEFEGLAGERGVGVENRGLGAVRKRGEHRQSHRRGGNR